MNCNDIQQWLRRDLDGRAEPSVEVAAHVERCPACRAEAERLKALAEMGRDALPDADVPVDFTHRVMGTLVEPTADEALATAARPRMRRWLPVLAVLLVMPFLPLLRTRPAVTGSLRVERGGAWVDADRAGGDDLFGLDAFAQAAAGNADVTALEPSLLRAAQPLELLGGQVHVETREPVVIRTSLADIRLGADSACLATLGKEKEMSFENLKKLAPTLLTVTLLAGGATVVNAQGEEKAEKEKPVTVEPGKQPEAGDPEITKALAEANRLLGEARAAMDLARLQQVLEVQEKDIQDQLAKVREILRQTRRELARLHPRADPLRQGQRQIVRRDPKTGEVIEVVRLDAWPESQDEEVVVVEEAAPVKEERARIDELLQRARKGDRRAKEELRWLLEKIETVVRAERPASDGGRVIERAEKEAARLKFAIDEASARMREDDADLDEEIRRRTQLQGRLMQLVELLDAARDQAELVDLYQRRGRTKEATEASRRLQDVRAELSELLRKDRMR